MSFPYKKEGYESIVDGSIKEGAVLGTSYLMGSSKPTMTATFMNFIKIGFGKGPYPHVHSFQMADWKTKSSSSNP